MARHEAPHPRWIGLGAVLALAALLVWWSPSRATPSGQVVQPGDISTPTPTYAIILVPTDTPDPVATPSVLEPTAGAGTYVVQPGDTLWSVALEVGVDVQEMPCSIAPHFRAEMPLVIGDTLHLPSPGWRCHTVAVAETLADIATSYGVTAAQIEAVAWNELGRGALPTPGTHLRIPPAAGDADGAAGFLTYMLGQPVGASPMLAYATGGPRAATTASVAGPLPKDWPYGSGAFTWPVFGWLSQPYRDDHRAVDIAAPTGTFVTASDRGVVVRAGWNDQGYGLFVVIDHNIDYVTLYSHLSEVLVSEGEVVAQGQVIGTVGTTGNSTGPHLHFEIRDFGRRTNPLGLLLR
jgi:murein DD-endopeptidase MepM/ murein hydrolase activator NlpD